MLNNFDYLWKRLLCVCVCVNSTFGRCCHCPCWKDETLYFKIDKAGLGEEDIKKCFNNTWYEKCQDKVLSLQQVNENGSDVLRVTGSGNKWTITDPQENKIKDDKCDSGKNKWIIVKVITLNGNTKEVGDSFIFYVDDITSVDAYGVFLGIECYSIKIIAANTRAVQNISYMFYFVESALEKDMKQNTAPGLIGLEKLNVENVTNMSYMFTVTIHKQATLAQLSEWRFSGAEKVCINGLFHSQAEGLNFAVLNGWSSAKQSGTVSFFRLHNCSSGQVFVDNAGKEFTAPRWYNYIKEVE